VLRPRPRCGNLQCSPRPLAVFKGPASKGREGEGERKGIEKGKGRGNDLMHSLSQIPGFRLVTVKFVKALFTRHSADSLTGIGYITLINTIFLLHHC